MKTKEKPTKNKDSRGRRKINKAPKRNMGKTDKDDQWEKRKEEWLEKGGKEKRKRR